MITQYPRDFGRPLAQIPREKLPVKKEIEPDGMEVFSGLSAKNYTKRLEDIEATNAAEVFKTVCAIAEIIKARGGRALLVGGSVRDEVLGIMSKDFDLEIYGMSADAVETVVRQFGKVDEVGKAFGILKVSTGNGFDIDVSLPRKDSQVGERHDDVQVKVDPGMSIKEAAKRRDFTFNALCKDPLTGEIFDGYGGVEDLRTRTLRVTDTERFQDDPLRLMRAAQFAGRFGMRIEAGSMNLMRSMIDKLEHLPKERMKEEWEKLLTKSIKPSIGLNALRDMGIIERYYPELAGLETTPQEFAWHPEGDVWIHTLMVVDEGANLIKRYEKTHALTDDNRSTIMWGALSHDLGKPSTTVEEKGRLTSKGHEEAGEEPTQLFLEKIGVKKETIQKVKNIVGQHLWPGMAYLNHLKGVEITDGAFRKLAKRIAPASILELTITAEADNLGRGPFQDPNNPEQFMLLLMQATFNAGDWVRSRAEELGVEKEPVAPPIQGRDLIALGLKPGRDFGDITRTAELLRDDCNMKTSDILLLIGTYATDPSLEGKKDKEKGAIVAASLSRYYESIKG